MVSSTASTMITLCCPHQINGFQILGTTFSVNCKLGWKGSGGLGSSSRMELVGPCPCVAHLPRHPHVPDYWPGLLMNCIGRHLPPFRAAMIPRHDANIFGCQGLKESQGLVKHVHSSTVQ